MSEPSPPVLLPTFRPARRRGAIVDPPMEGETGSPTSQPEDQPASPSPAGDATSPELDTPSPAQGRATRTPISATSEREPADPRITAGLVVALLGMAFAGAAAIARVRRGYQLRKPTRPELKAMGQPIGNILARHIPADKLNKDLEDLAAAAAAFTDYATADDLLVPLIPASGMPAGVNATEE